MKKFYLLLLIPALFAGCSKDFLKSYDDRILGQWHITGVNRLGIGGSTDHLPFRAGTFVFREDGTLTYSVSGNMYTGTWDIEKKYTGNDETLRTLKITAVDFNNQVILSQFYDDMNFVGTDHFKTTLISGYHTYVTHFRR